MYFSSMYRFRSYCYRRSTARGLQLHYTASRGFVSDSWAFLFIFSTGYASNYHNFQHKTRMIYNFIFKYDETSICLFEKANSELIMQDVQIG